MKLLLDANIIIDYMADRAPFADDAERIIELCARNTVKGTITASTVTDIYYILRKAASHDVILAGLRKLFSKLEVLDVSKADLLLAMDTDFPDLEDALIARCATKAQADYIVTRNVKDFRHSTVRAVTPAEFLTQWTCYD